MHKSQLRMYLNVLIALHLLYATHASEPVHPSPRSAGLNELADKENIDYWMDLGMEELLKAGELVHNEQVAKNIIIFVGDGMSIPTVSAARTFKGQHFSKAKGSIPEEGSSETIFWEGFPHMGLSKTYSTTTITPDSASTATAMFSGVKTASWTLGFDSQIIFSDPESVSSATPLKTILDWAQEAGMKTGIITNTRVTHATPAALYAKSADRDWECDSVMPESAAAQGLKDIALQMIENSPAKEADLIFGGGLGAFVDYDIGDDDYECRRNDKRNLINEWQSSNANGQVIYNRTQLMERDLMNADKIRGFFTWGYMPFEDQLGEESATPSLEEMTTTAIQYLERKSDENGFFLMVEGGKIDKGHHASQATRALSETIALEATVKAAAELVDTEETLLIVTADHSHTFSFGGYSNRFSDITMEALEQDDTPYLGMDGKPFTIFGYANGPGYNQLADENGTIVRPDIPSSLDYDFINYSGVPLNKETHGGDDVGIWAKGPMAHYFHTTHQQTYIAHVMSYAACIGPHQQAGRCSASGKKNDRNSV